VIKGQIFEGVGKRQQTTDIYNKILDRTRYTPGGAGCVVLLCLKREVAAFFWRVSALMLAN
jgi:hypothetical protein